MLQHLFCLLLLSCGVLSNPQSSMPCNRGDKKCLTSLFQGLYAAAFEGTSPASKIDPLFQKKIEAKFSTLEFTMRDTTIKGFKNCEIKDASIEKDKTTIHLAIFCPRFELTGQYEVDGKINTLALQGNGNFTLNANDYDVTIDAKLDTTNKNGDKYTKITDFEVEAELQGDLEFILGNLFNGDQQLADLAHKFIADHPKMVTSFLLKPVFEANIKKVIDTFNEMLEHTPVGGFIV